MPEKTVNLKKTESSGILLSESRLKHLSQKCGDYVDQKKVQGGVICIRHRGQKVYHESFGAMHGTDDSDPMPPNAIFPLASITKSLTATAVMILVEEGELDLAHTVPAYFRDMCHESWNSVTIASLLTHTSGVEPDRIWTTIESEWQSEHPGKSIADEHLSSGEVIRLGLKTPRSMPVDSKMRYNSFGYDLLSAITAKVSGTSFDTFVRERIFAPLGMDDSYIVVPKDVRDRVVTRKPADGSEIDWFSSEAAFENEEGSGGGYSTAGDMAVFAQMILKGGIFNGTRILSPASVRLMTTNRIPGVSATHGEEFFREASWGYGFNVRGYKCDHEGIVQTDHTVNHGGAGGVLMVIDFELGLACTIFTVPLSGNIRPLCNNIIFSAVEDIPVHRCC